MLWSSTLVRYCFCWPEMFVTRNRALRSQASWSRRTLSCEHDLQMACTLSWFTMRWGNDDPSGDEANFFEWRTLCRSRVCPLIRFSPNVTWAFSSLRLLSHSHLVTTLRSSDVGSTSGFRIPDFLAVCLPILSYNLSQWSSSLVVTFSA